MYSLIRLATLGTLASTALATCYFPNGDVSPSDTACDSSATDSACCFTGQACLSNGLCVSDPTNGTLARFHRGTCTDKNWNSDKCPGECTSLNNNGAPVYSCNSTTSDSYCCFDNCQCGSSKFETFSFSESPSDVYTVTIIGNKSFVQTHTSTSSAASSASNSASKSSNGPSSVSATVTGSSAATSAAASSSSSNGTAIGVGVGVGLGGALLLGAAAFFFFRRRSQKSNSINYAAGSAQKPAEVENNEYYAAPPVQKYAHHAATPLSRDAKDANSVNQHQHSAVSELPDQSFAPVELPGEDAPHKRVI